MSRDKIKEIFESMDEYVDDEFKNMIYHTLKRYRDQPTKRKLKHIIMNLPLGLIIDNSTLEGTVIDGGFPPKYDVLLDMLADKKQLLTLIERI